MSSNAVELEQVIHTHTRTVGREGLVSLNPRPHY